MNYFKDATNPMDWLAAVFSLLFIVPLFFNASGSLHWQAGAFAIFVSWVNFLLYLQRFGQFGIYVVMFGEIMKTLVCIIVLFYFLMFAFGLSFYALMLNQSEFSQLHLSVIQTFVMMVGELNYQSNFLEAFLNDRLPFPAMTFIIFVHFVLLMPILLMNLMIGLAVGDIAEVQRNAALKRIAMQIDLHTNLEEKLPYWFMKRVDKPFTTVYPNRKCSQMLLNLGENPETRTRLRLQSSRSPTPLENEQQKQKHRMKEMSNVLQKQHGLLKLIIQKMEITSEADDYDGPEKVKDDRQRSKWSQSTIKGSKWVPLMKAIEAKKC